MKKTTTLKLRLHRETLRALKEAVLPEVAGGIRTYPGCSVSLCAPTCPDC